MKMSPNKIRTHSHIHTITDENKKSRILCKNYDQTMNVVNVRGLHFIHQEKM